jgi:hypothetical protein
MTTQLPEATMLWPESPIPGMHPRQAAVLITVPEEAREAVKSRAHLLQNLTGGIYSGALYRAKCDLERCGGDIERLEAMSRADNHAAMGACARSGCAACARDL